MCPKSSSKQVEKTVNKSVNNDVKKINFSIIKNHYYSDAQGAGGGALNYTKPIITKSNDKKPSPQDLKKLVNEYKITDIPTSSQTKQNISNSKQIQIWENAKERNTTPKSNNAVDRFFGGAIQGVLLELE